ncbi:MAG: Gfo/Idh/MocA family oxidoreductase [Roseburia sp.]|nr:Gfo/Idh/MocA family oxidoreductase [Roseburia sp.]MCM1098251.1 Gfo/Idh/MocA family oxidoreductase [Ruminococcus flavefaciens]
MAVTTVVIAGAGGRGRLTYAPYAKKFPEQMKLVAAADRIPERLREMKEEYALAEDCCFDTVEEMFARPKMADMAFICTQDGEHVRHAMLALEKGYDLLLEKPVSAEAAECRRLLEKAEELGRSVTVCHVLRYAPFYQRLKGLLEEGAVGRVISIQASENVGYWHQAHSFVRGNWRRSDETSPMILAKCCHDMDLLVWLTESRCRRISSMGSLSWFREENAPAGAPLYCLDGCPVKAECPYDAEKIYITNPVTGYDTNGSGWMQKAVMTQPDREGLLETLKTSPYGRCVFRCDNNVVDNQSVTMEMENGITIGFHMCGLNRNNYRTIHIMGTKGDITGNLEEESLVLHQFGGEEETIRMNVEETLYGHGGGDYRMLHDMFEARSRGTGTLTSLRESLESHYMALAAERSRQNGGERVELEEFVRELL